MMKKLSEKMLDFALARPYMCLTLSIVFLFLCAAKGVEYMVSIPIEFWVFRNLGGAFTPEGSLLVVAVTRSWPDHTSAVLAFSGDLHDLRLHRYSICW